MNKEHFQKRYARKVQKREIKVYRKKDHAKRIRKWELRVRELQHEEA